MSEPQAKVFYDFEFCFINGQMPCFTVEEGRDKVAMDQERIRLEIHHFPTMVEEVIVLRSALAYMRTTQRTVQPPVQTQDAGSVRLVGA